MDNPLLTLGHSLLNRQNQGEKPHRLGAIPEQLALIPVSSPRPPGSPEESPLLLCREGRTLHVPEPGSASAALWSIAPSWRN